MAVVHLEMRTPRLLSTLTAVGIVACSSDPQVQPTPSPAPLPSTAPTTPEPADGGQPIEPDAAAPLKPPVRCTLEGKEGWIYLPTTGFTLEGKLAFRWPNSRLVTVHNVKGTATTCDLTQDTSYPPLPVPRPEASSVDFVTIERSGKLWQSARIGSGSEVYSPVPAPTLVCNKPIPSIFSHGPSSITYATKQEIVSLSLSSCAEEKTVFDIAALTPPDLGRTPYFRAVTGPRVWHLVEQDPSGQTLFAIDKASSKKIAEAKLPYGFDPKASNAPQVFSCGKEDFCVLTRSVFAQIRLDPGKGYRVLAERNAADLGKAEGWPSAQFRTPFTNFTSEEGRPADEAFMYVALEPIGVTETPGRLLRFDLVE